MTILRLVWRVLWRLVLSLLVIIFVIAIWSYEQGNRQDAQEKISKYEELATQSVIRRINFNTDYKYWDPTDKGTLYLLSFQYRDLQGRMRKGEVTTYSLPEDFNQQPMHFHRNDPTIYAFDVEHTVAEKVEEHSARISSGWFAFGVVGLVSLSCLAAMFFSFFPQPLSEADYLALDTEQKLKIRRKLARNGGEVIVSTNRGKVKLKIPQGSRSGLTLRIAGYGRQSEFDERVYGDAYVKLQVRRWPW